MKYSLILVRALFTTVTALLLVTVASGDCTPTGTWLSDVLNSSCGYQNNLSKTTNWNIRWPDGHSNGLQPSGSGKCENNTNCVGSTTSTQYCWPDFYTPVATADGQFTIHVRNYTTIAHDVDCPVWPFTWHEVLCSIISERDFSKSWTCPTNSDECEAQGYYCNFTNST